MPIQIGDKIIRTNSDYLSKPRTQITNTMRTDLKNDIFKLSKELDKPVSKILDCLVLTIESDEAISEKFIDILLRY